MSSNTSYGIFTSSEVTQEHAEREKKQSDMLQFFGKAQFCTVSVIDVVNSTKTTANISESKLGEFYSIFLNSVADIITKHKGVIVKNIGDSLLYYFAVTDTSDNCIANAFKCNFEIIEKRNKINELLIKNTLPKISYRISSDYGKVFVAVSAISAIDDIFGSTVNMCAKINHVGESNKFFIGNDLFLHAKSISGFKFDEIKNHNSNILKFDYPVYYVSNNNQIDNN